MDRFDILKSIHVLSRGLPVQVFDEEFQLIRSFESSQAKLFNYNYKALVGARKLKPGEFAIVSGSFNELFILYHTDENMVMLGPFRCSTPDRSYLERRLAEQGAPKEELPILFDYLSSLPLYALGGIRDLMIHLTFCFTGAIIDPLNEELHRYVRRFYIELGDDCARCRGGHALSTEAYIIDYETKILQCVSTGRTEKLRDMVFDLGGAVTPNVADDVMRSEKNYSIVVFEKLACAAVRAGADTIGCHMARDSFIRRNEACRVLDEILRVRDAAIVYFTNEVGKARNKGYSRLVSEIIRYIGLNTHRKIGTQEIARTVHLSVSMVQKRFKEETGYTVQQYIARRKIEEAKPMLRNGMKVTEVGAELGFFDASHFSRVFKKVSGSTPKQYQEAWQDGHEGTLAMSA